MNNDDISNLADTLGSRVDHESRPIRQGRAESHDVASLAKRLAASPEAVKGFLAAGILQPEGPVSKSEGNTHFVFASDDLNDLRKQVLAAVVARVIDADESDDPNAIHTAASHALREHVTETEKPDDKRRDFSRKMSHGGAIMFGGTYIPDKREHEDNGILRTAATAAAIAGVGAAGLGAVGHLGLNRVAKNLAHSQGPEAAAAFLRNNAGIGARIKAGWGLTRSAAGGVATGGFTGARSGVAGVLDELKRRSSV